MRESVLESKVRAYAISKGCLFLKFVSPGNPGVPDRILITPQGRVSFMEMKAPGCKPRPIQRAYIFKLQNHNCHADYYDSIDGAKRHIDSQVDAGPVPFGLPR